MAVTLITRSLMDYYYIRLDYRSSVAQMCSCDLRINVYLTNIDIRYDFTKTYQSKSFIAEHDGPMYRNWKKFSVGHQNETPSFGIFEESSPNHRFILFSHQEGGSSTTSDDIDVSSTALDEIKTVIIRLIKLVMGTGDLFWKLQFVLSNSMPVLFCLNL